MNLLLIEALVIPQEIHDCYTTESRVVYSEDQRILTLHLVPSGNGECDIFPPGVQFNLTLGTAASDHYSVVLREYAYATTESVVFTGVASFSSPRACYIRMFDYGQFTDFEVFRFEKEMSNLQNCFSEIVFNTLRDEVRLDLKPTGLCTNLFDVSTATLQKAHLIVFTQDYLLDERIFLDEYYKLAQFSITTPDVSKNLVYQPFLSASLQFDLLVGGQPFEFGVTITQFVSQVVPDIIPSALLGQWEDKFFVRAEPNENADIAGYLAIVGAYDEVDYRISFQHNEQQFKYLLRFMGAINERRALYSFDCDDLGSTAEQQDCYYFYDLMAAGTSFSMVFDIIFKDSGQFVIKYQQELSLVSTCWTRAVQMIGRSAFCVDLEWNDRCKQPFSGDLALVRLGEVVTGVIDGEEPLVLRGLNFQMQTQVCTPIAEHQWMRETAGYYIQLTVDSASGQFIVLSDVQQKADYFVMQIVTIVAGACYLLFVLAQTIHGIVITARSLRKLRLSKASKQAQLS